MITKRIILDTLHHYLDIYPQDAAALQDLRTLVNTSPDPTHRNEFRGHITCSGALVTDENTVLLIRHASLDKWLPPGGHLEPSDHSLEDAARREIEEEVLLPRQALRLIGPGPIPFDIDRHPIPASSAKAEPAHEHWDLRFAFRMPTTLQPRITAEATALRYVRLVDPRSRWQTRLAALLYQHNG